VKEKKNKKRIYNNKQIHLFSHNKKHVCPIFGFAHTQIALSCQDKSGVICHEKFYPLPPPRTRVFFRGRGNFLI
jgi:hypothetical protein